MSRSAVDRELRKLGFGGLDDPNLVPQIAFCIRNHEQFRSQLMSVEPGKRHLAYTQLRPHLRFQAKPLDVYEAEMKLLAEQQQLPTLREGEIYPTPFKPATLEERATAALAPEKQKAHPDEVLTRSKTLTLICANCLKEESFHSWSRILAELKATDAGWYSEGDKSWCKEHKPSIQ
jgi:hypothetical protein